MNQDPTKKKEDYSLVWEISITFTIHMYIGKLNLSETHIELIYC